MMNRRQIYRRNYYRRYYRRKKDNHVLTIKLTELCSAARISGFDSNKEDFKNFSNYPTPGNNDRFSTDYIKSLCTLYKKVRLNSILVIYDNFVCKEDVIFNKGLSNNAKTGIVGYYNAKYNHETLNSDWKWPYEGSSSEAPEFYQIDSNVGKNPMYIEYYYDNTYSWEDMMKDNYAPPKLVSNISTEYKTSKKKIITSKTRLSYVYKPRQPYAEDSEHLYEERKSFAKFLKDFAMKKVPPVLYIRIFDAEHDKNIKDNAKLFVKYMSCRVRFYYQFVFSGRQM